MLMNMDAKSYNFRSSLEAPDSRRTSVRLDSGGFFLCGIDKVRNSDSALERLLQDVLAEPEGDQG